MDDLGAVMDTAGSEQAAIFGVSEGGPMSLLFAATHPERVTALVLYGTFARMLKAPDYPEGVREELFDSWGDRVRSRVGWARRGRHLGAERSAATRTSNAGGRGCCARAPARPARST